MSDIKVSVIIPVFNQQELVARAIKSVPKRDDVEIIVVDDGSTDMSNLVSFICLNVAEYVLIHSEKNRGVAYAMNRGYDAARGEYVVPLGSDDYFLTDNFNKVVDEYLDGTDMVYFDLEINDGNVLKLNEKSKDGYCGSTKFTRREFLGNSRCPENKKAGEDYFLYQELQAKKPTEKFTNLVVKHYNYPREGSLSWQVRNGKVEL